MTLWVMGQVIPSASVAAKAPGMPLAQWHLDFGDRAQLWSPASGADLPDGWQRTDAIPGSPGALDDGTWTVDDIRFVDERFLDLHVSVTPPIPAMALDDGPATMFTSLGITGGGGGDVGYRRLVSIGHTALPTCGDPCRFEADVRLDLRGLPHVLRGDGATDGRVMVGFTLLRTFAGGTWLQAIESSDLSRDAFSTGNVGHPESWVGRTEPFGLYSAVTATPVADGGFGSEIDYLAIVEADRTSMGDTSVPAASTPVRVIATITGCRGPLTASFGTTEGDRVLLVPRHPRDYLDSTVKVPVGTSWRLGWQEDWSAGIAVGDAPLLVAATLRCSDRDGPLIDDMAVAEIQPR